MLLFVRFVEKNNGCEEKNHVFTQQLDILPSSEQHGASSVKKQFPNFVTSLYKILTRSFILSIVIYCLD